MRTAAIFIALAAVPALWAGDPPAANKKQTGAVQTRQYSREMLDRLRHSLTAQIAVREEAEGAMRAPTPEEAAALAGPSSDAATAINLKNGGVALRRDASQMSFAVAEIGADGKAKISHELAQKSASQTAKAGKGAGNGR